MSTSGVSGHLIALLVAFAFGLLIALDAMDRHAPACKPATSTSVRA